MTLQFTPTTEGRYEASFLSSDYDAIHLSFNAPKQPNRMTISARLDPDMPWVDYDRFSSIPQSFIHFMDAPSGVYIRIMVDNMPEYAELIQSDLSSSSELDEPPLNAIQDVNGFFIVDRNYKYIIE